MHDVIVIGGSFAGLAAATQLGRARRDVVVLDAGQPRNRMATATHGLLGYDGAPPDAILTAARFQLRRYDTVEVQTATVVSARRENGGFVVGTAGGAELKARKLVLAHGLVDEIDGIPGMAECWGRTVLHCPYCHGYEFAGRPIGLMVRGGEELQLARFYREWTDDVTLLSNGAPVDAGVRAGLAQMNVRLVETAVMRFEHYRGVLRGVIFADTQLALAAVFVHPPARFAAEVGIGLGCETEEGALGPRFTVDSRQETTVEGVYAAGDIARAAHYLSLAIADGTAAGVFAHQSLVYG